MNTRYSEADQDLSDEDREILAHLLEQEEQKSVGRFRISPAGGRDGEAVQVIDAPAPIDLPVTDLDEAATAGGEGAMQEFCREIPLREGGAYLVTGGLGNLGLTIANAFVDARRFQLPRCWRPRAACRAVAGEVAQHV
jgi:hypothetical protein